MSVRLIKRDVTESRCGQNLSSLSSSRRLVHSFSIPSSRRNEVWGSYYQGFMLSQGDGCGEDVVGGGGNWQKTRHRYDKSPTSKIYTTWARILSDLEGRVYNGRV